MKSNELKIKLPDNYLEELQQPVELETKVCDQTPEDYIVLADNECVEKLYNLLKNQQQVPKELLKNIRFMLYVQDQNSHGFVESNFEEFKKAFYKKNT